MNRAESRLRELTANVDRCHRAVEEATNPGAAETAKRARRTAIALLRAHCEKNGLDLPHNLPSEDDGGGLPE